MGELETTPESYALSLANLGHTAQSVLMATGINLGNAPKARRSFDPSVLSMTFEKADDVVVPVSPIETFEVIETQRDKIDADLKDVARRNKIKVSDIKNHCRKRIYSFPRQEMMYLLRTKYGFSYPRIARYLGYQDHTSAIHGVKRYCERQGIDYETVFGLPVL